MDRFFFFGSGPFEGDFAFMFFLFLFSGVQNLIFLGASIALRFLNTFLTKIQKIEQSRESIPL